MVLLLTDIKSIFTDFWTIGLKIKFQFDSIYKLTK